MKLFDHADLDRYLEHDEILRALADSEQPGDPQAFGCHRWLTDSAPKRMVFAELYGDLLSDTDRRVLDVGGGITSLTRRLGANHAYSLIDFLAHDDHGAAARLFADLHTARWLDHDWDQVHAWGRDPFDVIVANDIFPNVDQRLVPFLEAALPRCAELRLSLTWYDPPRYYRVRRTDADEILHVMAWGQRQLVTALAPYADRIVDADASSREPRDSKTGDLVSPRASLYPNRRQVGVLILRGEFGAAP